MGRLKKYQTEEERKAANRERVRKWREANHEKSMESNRKWAKANPDKVSEKIKNYYRTPIGRAIYLANTYRQNDKKHNRGECTLTSQWIINNIFSKSCIYCGETDWRKLGCDRIDNSLPHTPDNVVCSCWNCNNERKNKPFEEFLQKSKEIPKPITDASPLFTGS